MARQVREKTSWLRGVDPIVFFTSGAISVAFVIWGAVFTDNLGTVASSTLDFLITQFGWMYLLAATSLLIFSILLAVSRYGTIRLGKDDDRPEFRTVSWIAMMFSAGMGIGLMFYGVAEPISHFSSPPPGSAPAGTDAAAQVAMQYTFFHWGLHPWAMYAVVGLALAYFAYRKGHGNLISSAFRPLLGDRVDGGLGKAIEILAIFATLFGSATSLGLGALQINDGLNFLWGIETSITLAIVVIGVLTVMFILSAVSGVEKGIQWLSNTNMVLAGLLALFILAVGPLVYIINTFIGSIGAYVWNIVPMSFRTGAFGGEDWIAGWTIFYWAWWISWAPFVGAFIARISKGRTIREFIVGVLLVPSGASFIWFSIFGGTAINLTRSGADITGAVEQSQAGALFATLEQFPLPEVTAFITVLLVVLFFVSGADAASIVLGTLSSQGDPEPARPVVIFWGTLTGAAAAVLLVAGGLTALQQAAIITAGPFTLVMIGLCWGLFRSLRTETLPGLPERRPVGASQARWRAAIRRRPATARQNPPTTVRSEGPAP
jgi:glycine betaine transporter